MSERGGTQGDGSKKGVAQRAREVEQGREEKSGNLKARKEVSRLELDDI